MKAIYIIIQTRESYYRYSKIKTLLMAHNWHLGASMSTNVKITIFGTYPVKSANVNRNKYSKHIFKHDHAVMLNLQLLLFISILKSELWKVIHFLTTRTIFITLHTFAFSTYHKFKFLWRFCNKYGFRNISRYWE